MTPERVQASTLITISRVKKKKKKKKDETRDLGSVTGGYQKSTGNQGKVVKQM